MLALSTRRQHLPRPHCSSPSSHPFSHQHLLDQKLFQDYLESQQQQQQQSFTLPTSSAASSVMTTFDFMDPTVHIQRSTPQPLAQPTFSQSSMLSADAASAALDSWETYPTAQPLQSLVESVTGAHRRAASSSSVSSSASPIHQVGPSTSYPYVAGNAAPMSDTSYLADPSLSSFSADMATPTHTPMTDSYVDPSHFNGFSPVSNAMDMAVHMSVNQALMDRGDDVPDFAHSGRQSVSSLGHDSPATPLMQADDLDFKLSTNDVRPSAMAKFDTAFADSFYTPTTVSAPALSQPKPAQVSLLSPYRHTANDKMQRTPQAQCARSQSPASSASPAGSPFIGGSPYRQTASTYSSPLASYPGVARAPNRQLDTTYAMKSQMRLGEDVEPKTISPKDMALVYPGADEDSKTPLFPDGSPFHGPEYNTASAPAQSSYRRDSWPAPPSFPSTLSTAAAAAAAAAPAVAQASGFDFGSAQIQGDLHSLSLTTTTPQYRSTPASIAPVLEPTPEFPAHLTSMESSASEAEPPTASQDSDLFHKPPSSRAETGTYSCTYHGCPQRFETPQKLQKHKREGHRNTNPGPTMTSAAMLERNSQAGPHRCDRVNPTTGKPCGTVFSRPYDLTRHEDTIHNARKQKVRCALCAEEKTFSRSDALTRHMRVVHPEIDFTGKHHRRRGGNHD